MFKYCIFGVIWVLCSCKKRNENCEERSSAEEGKAPCYLAHYFNLKIMERKEEGVWIKKQIEQRIRRSSSSRDVSEANRPIRLPG